MDIYNFREFYKSLISIIAKISYKKVIVIDAAKLFKTNDISQDEYNTYFRTITTDTQTFTHIQEKTNVYQLVLYFPQKYNTLNYQDIIEAIEIDVKSKQVI